MKIKLLSFFIIAGFLTPALLAGNPAMDYNPAGKWNFNAAYAPAEYSTGTMDISLQDNNYKVLILFRGSDYKHYGEKIKFEDNNLNFTVYIEGQSIAVSLKLESQGKMTGKAVYSDGETNLNLSRQQEKK